MEIHFKPIARGYVMADVAYNDFAKLDIRVARIVSAQSIAGKSRILKGRIDLGWGGG